MTKAKLQHNYKRQISGEKIPEELQYRLGIIWDQTSNPAAHQVKGILQRTVHREPELDESVLLGMI
jgi:hypothetical protein